jgi:hypothetical protein
MVVDPMGDSYLDFVQKLEPMSVAVVVWLQSQMEYQVD